MPVPIVPSVPLASSTYGAESSVFGARQTAPSTINSATVLSPPGFYFVATNTHSTVQFTADGGGTYQTLLAASSTGMVFSDGITVQIKNDGTGGTTASYYQILGGPA